MDGNSINKKFDVEDVFGLFKIAFLVEIGLA
jgi:hypothetical protein